MRKSNSREPQVLKAVTRFRLVYVECRTFRTLPTQKVP